MNIKKENIDRFLRDMAFFVEAHPNPNPEANKFWAKIRKKYIMDCLKWGRCEICGQEGILGECGFTWICEGNKNCLKIADDCNRRSIDEFRREQDELGE